MPFYLLPAPQTAKGFTLMEVIVTLVILSAGAAVILSQTTGLLDYAFRARQQSHATSQLMSDFAQLPHQNLQAMPQKLVDKGRALVVELDHTAPMTHHLGPIEVHNIAMLGVDVYPKQGYSPYQMYTLALAPERGQKNKAAPSFSILFKGMLPEGQDEK